MSYAAVFAVLGLAQAGLARMYGGWGWLLLWPGFSCLVVGLAYAGLGPAVFGKRPDGTISPPVLLLLLPFLLFTWAVWWVQILVERRRAFHEIAPGIWLGRRALPRELPADITLVVDLTAEFPEPLGIRDSREYICLPTLDSRAPDPQLLRMAVERAAEHRGGTFVHCANGSGRSAMFAAILLVRQGICPDAAVAEEYLKARRPGVLLYREQRLAVRQICEGFGTTQSYSA